MAVPAHDTRDMNLQRNLAYQSASSYPLKILHSGMEKLHTLVKE